MPTSLPPPTRFLIERRKITAYLLNASHPDGGSKAKFFLSRGFSLRDIETFAQRILDHPISPETLLVAIVTDSFAPKFVYEGPLSCPDGSEPLLRSVWETRDSDTEGRLVTAYPCT